MASTVVTVLTPTITGAAISAKGSVACAQTVTITPSTAQGSLDTATLMIRITNGSAAIGATVSIGAGDNYSGVGKGAATVSIATATSVLVGGQFFESNRFLTSSETIVLTQTAGTGPCSYEAYQRPRATE